MRERVFCLLLDAFGIEREEERKVWMMEAHASTLLEHPVGQ